ncbi:PD-(D/E)XK motif protein (plasmid) [Rhodovastum atsumiense]|uniref:PD-(D/E)XK motif protein n=1 Tax=Rhodovastum atsumiense TaxID=504468 RepID=A0A5M6IVE4_9PROT|nr:PD-(D/E)XK motif protein [Rhodovastum atsumiense]KAA5611817.1 PD-(D/E)XK motif protein [Rhodovastum atsumiense]CAH2606073.1 PD-(D/E)XK motif protein [Rhodovastum atsumiense]
MAEGPTPEQWAGLRAARPVAEDALATMPVTAGGKDTPVLMAMDSAGHLHLLVPVQRGPAGPKPPDLTGLRVRHRHLESLGQVLDLTATPAHERVFTPVCREVVDAVLVQRRDPWAAVGAIVRAWQSAWKPARPEMDKTTQVGLFGELLVLQRLMIPCLGPAAVGQWSGPEFERHDFVGERLHVEVKTTRKSRHEHEISRLDQLRAPEGCQLLVVSVQVEESVGGNETLATAIDAVTDQLRGDAAALDAFMAKLVNVGWSDEMVRSGELVRFFLRDASIFAVDDEFPRLPDDFVPPSGVVAVKYTIDLANLPSLGMDEATEIIRETNLHTAT